MGGVVLQRAPHTTLDDSLKLFLGKLGRGNVEAKMSQESPLGTRPSSTPPMLFRKKKGKNTGMWRGNCGFSKAHGYWILAFLA